MPKLTIDNQTIEVAEGTTILEAAEQLHIEIPTLCYLRGYEPSTSCQVCLVKDRRRGQLLPSCATKVVEGMEIDSETDEVRAVRRTALELLFSDHVGDCIAPCFFACPAHMDIPLMLQQIGEHELRNAVATVKRDIALPAVLGRACPKPCEKGCRRNAADDPVAVCDLKRFVADVDLASDDPYCPPCQPDTGKRVAIVGAGTTGLAAAYYLRQEGHHCVIHEKQHVAGGRLRTETQDELPSSVLDAEIQQVLRLGVELRTDSMVSRLEELENEFDAVLLACGHTPTAEIEAWGVKVTKRGIDVDKETLLTSRAGVFAAGNAIRSKGLVVRSVADGKLVAKAIGEFLAGRPITPPAKPFSSRIGTLQAEEAQRWATSVSSTARLVPLPGTDYAEGDAAGQSDRCLSCGCLSHGSCELERYAIQYGADPTRFAGERRLVEIIQRPGGIRFEPHKCIKCELCIQIAAAASEPLGLAFVGRGFDVQLAVPFDGTMDDALTKTAAECVAACPTAAIAFSHTSDIPSQPTSTPDANEAHSAPGH